MTRRGERAAVAALAAAGAVVVVNPRQVGDLPERRVG
jgi:hypothetical protein